MGHGSCSFVFSDRVRERSIGPQLIGVPVIRCDPLERGLHHVGDRMPEMVLLTVLIVHARRHHRGGIRRAPAPLRRSVHAVYQHHHIAPRVFDVAVSVAVKRPCRTCPTAS